LLRKTPKITNALVCYSAAPTCFLQAVESLNADIGFETKKRPEKYAGFPTGWKKRGPLLFSTHPPSSGLFSAPYAMEVPQKKKGEIQFGISGTGGTTMP
jgi:hypothetical protein